MAMPLPAGRVRFGVFEVNLRSGELHKHGVRIKLHDQPFQILAMLLEHPGEVVTREQLRQKLWPADTFVDFDVGLNSAVNKLRDALGDSAEKPRFVETLPRRGYRFITPVESMASASAQDLAVHTEDAASVPGGTLPMRHAAAQGPEGPGARRPAKLWIAAGAFAAILALFAGLNVGGLRQRVFGRAGAARIQSIAVLPLDNLTGDPAQEYFVDGMTEELITDLGKIGELRVISRTSVMRYKGTKKSLQEIARELQVDALVEGTVARSGDRVRITANLVQASPERHLWADRFERDLRDVLALQDDVSRAIANGIQIKLTPQEKARLARSQPVNPEAYEAYLRGRHFWNKRNKAATDKAIEYFRQAIRIDPNYAPAYSGLADSYVAMGFGALGGMAPKEAAPKAKEAAIKAVELDDTLAEAHASLAFVKVVVESDFAGAEKQFRRAIELNSGYANSYQWYSQLLERLGNHPEALEKARRAVQLEPASAIMQTNLGRLLFWPREYDQAIEHLRLAVELDPNLFTAHHALGYALEYKGMLKEALAEQQKAFDLNPQALSVKGTLAHLYAVSGRRAEAERISAELKARAGEPNYAYLASGVSVALGQKDEALELLERAYQGRSQWMDWLAADWYFDPLRSDPRFQDLLRRVKSGAQILNKKLE